MGNSVNKAFGKTCRQKPRIMYNKQVPNVLIFQFRVVLRRKIQYTYYEHWNSRRDIHFMLTLIGCQPIIQR